MERKEIIESIKSSVLFGRNGHYNSKKDMIEVIKMIEKSDNFIKINELKLVLDEMKNRLK